MAQRLVYRIRRRDHARIYRDRIDQFDQFSDRELVSRYRFGRADFMWLVGELGADLSTTPRGHNIPPVMQITIALRFFASGSFQEVVGDNVGVTRMTICRCIHRVASALARRTIQWVHFERDASATKRAFMAIANFPNVIGCIDCTHVRIIGKSHNNAFFKKYIFFPYYWLL